MSVADKVKSIIVEVAGVPEEYVTPEATFLDDLGMDSLDAVELIRAFEEEFEISIGDVEVEDIDTAGQALIFIEERLKNK